MTEQTSGSQRGGDTHRAGLQNATLEGVRWLTYGRVVYEIMAFASLAILAHLIPPAAYGHAAIALVCQTLAFTLTNEGFGNPLVQRKSLRAGHLESASFMSLAFGAAIGAIVFFGAPYVITPLYGQETTYLVQLGSTMFPIYSLAVVPEAILMRRLDLRVITIAETGGPLAGMILSIVLAILGFSGAAIVLGTVAGAAITAGILLVMVGMPPPRWRRKEGGDITRFGVPASLAGLSFLGIRNVDNVLIGARLGATQLGLYYRAFALGVNNQMKIGAILMKIALPAYSRAEDDHEMRRMRHRMFRLNSAVIVPLLVLLIVTAPTLVPFLLGAQWEAAIVPTQILAGGGIATCMTYCVTPFLLAAGHPRSILMLNLGNLFVYASAVLLALPHGLRAVCFAVVATYVLMLFVSYLVMNRLTSVPARHLWLDHAPALVGGAAVATVTVPLMAALSHLGLPSVPLLAGVIGVGVLVYVLVIRLLFKRTFQDALLVLGGIARRRKASTGMRFEAPVTGSGVQTQSSVPVPVPAAAHGGSD